MLPTYTPILEAHTRERCLEGCKVYEPNAVNNVQKCEVTDLGTAAVLAIRGESEAFSCIVHKNVVPHTKCQAKCMTLPKAAVSLPPSSSRVSKPSLSSVTRAKKPGPVDEAIRKVLPFSSSSAHHANIQDFVKDPSKGVRLW